MLNKQVQRIFCLALVRKSHQINAKLFIRQENSNLLLQRSYFPSSSIAFFSTQQSQSNAQKMSASPEKAENVYQFQVKDLDGETVPLSDFKGKVLLVVNTATNCGLTKSNIKGLKEINDKFKDKNFQVLGFPSNDFKQELSCETDIKEFVKKNNIDFPYFGKIQVNGNDAEPLYKYLKAKQQGTLTNAIKWNFTKFLVDRNGIPVKRYGPTTAPADIEKDIEQLTKQ